MKLNKNKAYHFILMLTIIVFGSCSSDDDTAVEEVVLYDSEIAYDLENIPYGNEVQQVADIYLPAGRDMENTKVLLLIHGGAWVSGDKEDMDYMVQITQNRYPDYAIVNMNYRFPSETETAFPMQIDDVRLLMDHLTANKETYNIAEQVGMIGVSSGAHLALLYAYAHDEDNQVQAVCSIVGPTDFTDENYLNSVYYNPFRIILIGDYEYDTHPEKFEEVSPVHRATATAPPSILFYGDQDPLVPTTQGILLHNRLNELEVVNEYYLYENAGHGDWSSAQFAETEERLVDFFGLHL